jgi:hypothetical protein
MGFLHASHFHKPHASHAPAASPLRGTATHLPSHPPCVLQVFMKKPECVQPLMIQISSSTAIEARQMAAVLLRKKIGVHFKKLPADLQTQVKNVRPSPLPTRFAQHRIGLIRSHLDSQLTLPPDSDSSGAVSYGGAAAGAPEHRCSHQ